ncbi:MAG: BON domain-containing protein, partial [Butyrivibrio sp.]|nr:BON domain-containing protein [Butyrivibrio sp.]
DKDDYRAAQEKKLKELLISQKAVNTVLYEEKIDVNFLEVKIEEGKAVLLGSTSKEDDIIKAGEIVKKVTGIEIENNLSLENFTMSYDMGMEFFKK